MDDKLPVGLLGPDVASYISSVLRPFCSHLTHTTYSYMPDEEFAAIFDSDITSGTKIYVTEIVYRAHSAALTILCKVLRWTDGVIMAAGGSNLLVFAASLRGLLECAADALDLNRILPLGLASSGAEIIKAIRGEMESFINLGQLEDVLIHYSHATCKPDKQAPATHKAKLTRDYIDGLSAMNVPHVHNCYRELCDLTHPGALAHRFFFETQNGYDFTFSNVRDKQIIAHFCRHYQELFSPLLEFACIPAFVTLRIINSLGLPHLIIEELNEWCFADLGLWQKVKACMPNIEQ